LPTSCKPQSSEFIATSTKANERNMMRSHKQAADCETSLTRQAANSELNINIEGRKMAKTRR